MDEEPQKLNVEKDDHLEIKEKKNRSDGLANIGSYEAVMSTGSDSHSSWMLVPLKQDNLICRGLPTIIYQVDHLPSP